LQHIDFLPSAGKTFESTRNYRRFAVVSTLKKMQRLVSMSTLKDIKMLDDGVYLFEMEQLKVRLDKPVYTGMVCLDLAKLFMVSYHYKLLNHFGQEKIKLLYSDTDSLVYQFFVPDLYQSLIPFKNDFDFSSYPPDHPLYNTINRTRRGKWKDEMKKEQISEAVFLRPKCYAIKMDSSSKVSGPKAAAGVSRANQEKLTYEDYKDTLFYSRPLSVEQRRFASVNHQIYTYEQSRLALNIIDNKRYQMNKFDTLPYGHHLLDFKVKKMKL
jgi:hypothetical protein